MSHRALDDGDGEGAAHELVLHPVLDPPWEDHDGKDADDEVDNSDEDMDDHDDVNNNEEDKNVHDEVDNSDEDMDDHDEMDNNDEDMALS